MRPCYCLALCWIRAAISWIGWRSSAKIRPNIIGDWLPHRPLANALNVVKDIIEHPAALIADVVAIRPIKTAYGTKMWSFSISSAGLHEFINYKFH
jgi:hypothetical protein